MKVAFHTLGCKVNQYETESLRELFLKRNYQIVGEGDFADIYVINTCTVTGIADRKSRQAIRRLKKQNPESIIAVTGCYAQMKPEEVFAVPGVDIVLGTKEKAKLPDHVEDYLKKQSKVCQTVSFEEMLTYEETEPITAMESKTRAMIKIQEGCDRFCTYCIIPYARGAVRSRSLDSIAAEAQNLIAKGFKEIVLTGINTALYEPEEDEGLKGIETVVSRLSGLPGDFRIRLSSLEPTVIDAEYVKRLFEYDKLCHHIHLSLQSGSDEILKQMNRRYCRSDYLSIVDVLKEFDAEYGITTDIIVGFPGESEADFQESLKMVRDVDFCKVHVFKYSKRKGTPAAEAKGQISGEIKAARATELIRAGEASKTRFFERNIGRIRQVLIEAYLEDSDCYTGYSDNYIKVYVRADRVHVNAFFSVKLTALYKDGMLGEIQ